MKMCLISVRVCLLLSFPLLIVASIPDYIHVCHASDPNITACIIDSVEHLRPKIRDGIPELEVPPTEPLALGNMRLRRPGISTNLTDIKVWGPASFIITDLRLSLEKNWFYFKIRLPRLHFDGQYEMNMRILLLNLRGKGPIQGNFTDYRCEVFMKGNKIVKDDEEYLKFDKMRLRILEGRSKLRLSNLFNGDPVLGRISNDLVDEYTSFFIAEMRPILENSLAEKFTEIANKITLRFSYKELFP